jgi:PAS domain S-box-containing protein
MLQSALDAVKARGDHLPAALDELPAAIYITDADGTITHFNKACIALAGRTPVVRHDKWCVTWKIYTTKGEFLPHDQCPMAVAVRERRPIRGVEAIAERPDGTRINFVPYPTPLFDDDGEFVGAVNMLIDVTERKQASALRAQAAKCRRLAASITDRAAAATLKLMAAEYDEQADQVERPN